MTDFDRDHLVRVAVSVPAELSAPPDLGDDILRAVLATPQRRRSSLPDLDALRQLGRSPLGRTLVVAAALVALLLAVALAAVLTRPPSPAQIAMYHGGPERTGVMPGPGPGDAPGILWDVPRPGALRFTTMPVMTGGAVLVADSSGAVAALEPATGRTTWEVTTLSTTEHGSPALAGDLLVLATETGHVEALRLADGSVAWDTAAGTAAISASLVVDGGRVYAGGEDGVLHVLDAMSGKELWTASLGQAITRGPAIRNGVLYVGATGGRFVAIDTATHAVRWTTELGPGEVGTPIAGSDLVYVGRGVADPQSPHDVVALDAATGRQRWEFLAPDQEQVHAGGLAGGMLFAASEDGTLFALDAGTGALRWQATTAGGLGTGVSIAGDVVYLGSADRTVRALALATGAERWRIDVPGVPTSQAVLDGRVIFGTSLGDVVAIGDAPGTNAGGASASERPAPS